MGYLFHFDFSALYLLLLPGSYEPQFDLLSDPLPRSPPQVPSNSAPSVDAAVAPEVESYGFLGLAAMLGLIAFALLVCSFYRHPNGTENDAGNQNDDRDVEKGEESDGHVKAVPVLEEISFALQVVSSEGNSEEKKMKVCAEEESNKSTTTTTGSSDTNKKDPKGPSNSNSKVSDVPKPDYIHVRARRGEATDSHSFAERVRREKISERMKFLQDLVPGCNKIAGKARMLDEIINYIQSLQRQVEFLSMKLASVNRTVDSDIDNYITKEIFPACPSSFPTSDHLQLNSLIQEDSGAIPEIGVLNPTVGTLRRATAPVSHDTFLDLSCLTQIHNPSSEDELQNLFCMEYQQGRTASFTSQPYTGLQETGHVKLEM